MPGAGSVRRHVHRQHDVFHRRGARPFAARIGLRTGGRPTQIGIVPTRRGSRIELAAQRHSSLGHPHEESLRKRRGARRVDGRLYELNAASSGDRTRSKRGTHPERHPRHLDAHAPACRHEAGRPISDVRPRPGGRSAGRYETPARGGPSSRGLHDRDGQDGRGKPGRIGPISAIRTS